MAVTITNRFDICLIQGDPVELTAKTLGSLKALVNETVKFFVKAQINDPDSSAIIAKTITVTEEGIIDIYVSSSETNVISEGLYYWSLKHIKTSNEYVIVPDNGCQSYPKFQVKEALIDD